MMGQQDKFSEEDFVNQLYGQNVTRNVKVKIRWTDNEPLFVYQQTIFLKLFSYSRM